MEQARYIAKVITSLATAVALVISIGLPGLFFAFVLNAEVSGLKAELEISAAIVNRAIRLNPLLWKYDQETFEDLFKGREFSSHNDNAYILLPGGDKIAEKSATPPGPFFSRTYELNDAGKTVAFLVMERSTNPLIKQTLIVFLFSSALGLALFALIKTLPHRIIRRAEKELLQLAYYDPLTALPNRTLLNDRLEQVVHRAGRDECQAAILLLDLDRFKNINDSLGYKVGEQLLKQVAVRLEKCLRGTDTVARYGGDEFVIILSQVPSDHEKYITLVARKIIQDLEFPVIVDGKALYTSCCIGISVFPLDGQDGQSLLKYADLAMYQAKKRGRKNLQFFSMDLNRKARERMRLETSLRQALEQNHLYLQYQPKLDFMTGKISGIEALTRWNHPEMGLISPAHFIPLAEETGIIHSLGPWILSSACRQHVIWQKAGLSPPPLAVNLSIRQLMQKDFIPQVESILEDSGLSPGQLELELTESCLMESSEDIIGKLKKLRELGVKIAIDDFGTGYSSLGYLKHFPVDRLKIDRCFVKDISSSDNDSKIAQTIIVMAKNLGLQVTAEGVELKEQLNILLKHGCDEIQGYLYSQPLSTTDLEKFLVRDHSTPSFLEEHSAQAC